MKELSLNILDITENSVKAGATLTEITVDESDDTLTITIADNGCGMSTEVIASVSNPFYTTRKTRRVGLGIPLLVLAAEQTGGTVRISSRTREEFPDSHGTTVVATFYKNHIDFTPLGDVAATLQTLVQGHPDVDFKFVHRKGDGEIMMDTRQMREVLEEIPLDSFEVISWLGDNLREQYSDF